MCVFYHQFIWSLVAFHSQRIIIWFIFSFTLYLHCWSIFICSASTCLLHFISCAFLFSRQLQFSFFFNFFWKYFKFWFIFYLTNSAYIFANMSEFKKLEIAKNKSCKGSQCTAIFLMILNNLSYILSDTNLCLSKHRACLVLNKLPCLVSRTSKNATVEI